MKLYKALKLKKRLIGEIAVLKEQINAKNSYLNGSINEKNYSIDGAYEELLIKIDDLVGLKYAINQANAEIQGNLYVLSEYKALIAFWKGVDVSEGLKKVGYQDNVLEYKTHVNEEQRDNYILTFQKRVDSIQDMIDEYNYTTIIDWDKQLEELDETDADLNQ